MIDLEEERGKRFMQLARALHERRIGRVGGRRWNRTVTNSVKIRPPLDLLYDYQHGDPPLSDVHNGWQPHIRQYVRMGNLNIAGLLVSSTSNRMQLRDFRTAAAEDELGDVQARDIMLANELEVISGEVHDFMLGLGDGYAMVTPPGDDGKWATITPEDPRQVITIDDPMTRRPVGGLKLFRDDWDSADLAYLHLPGGKVFKAIRPGRTTINNAPFRVDAQSWDWVDDEEQDTPGGRFAIVRFPNLYGTGEFEEHLSTLDRINDKIFNEWWIGKIQAFRQRAVKNLPDTETVKEGGKEVEKEIDYTDMFRTSPDEMWRVPGDVEFWESTPVDPGPITNSIKHDLERLAASVSQPLHTITPDAAAGSAEGAALMREEHLFKIRNRLARVNRRWAEVMSLAFEFQGDKARAEVTKIIPMWDPIQRFSLTEMASAASQLKGILPNEAIRRDVLQYSPAEVIELRTLDGADFLLTAQPPAPPRAVPGPAPEPTPAPVPAAS